jgi:hypothetical protein
LAEIVAVAFGWFDLAGVFDGEEFCLFVQFHLPCRAEGNDDVISLAEGQVAELAFERAAAIVNPPRFVGLRVAVEEIHFTFGGAGDTEDDVVVSEQGNSSSNRISSERGWMRGKGAVANGAKIHVFRFGGSEISHLFYARWKEVMVENGLQDEKPSSPINSSR